MLSLAVKYSSKLDVISLVCYYICNEQLRQGLFIIKYFNELCA